MIELRMMPAREGDALWIRWGQGDEAEHQMMVDMGTEATGNRIRQDLEAMSPLERTFELLVVTHMDRDHIGGVLTCLAEAPDLEGLSFKDVWFNGWAHLDGQSIENGPAPPAELETMGPAQGERLTRWLEKRTWNGAFGGAPVVRTPGSPLLRTVLPGNLSLTVIGPTPDRLSELKPVWKAEVQKALEKGALTTVSAGLEVLGSDDPPVIESQDDLEILAESENKRDDSEANGSSIALLLEFDGTRILLCGDAFPKDVEEGLETLGEGLPVALDAVKLPHHGSSKNVHADLIGAVATSNWLFSTDGNRFKHPDSIAIARILLESSTPQPELFFNVPSKFNGWWNNDDWKALFEYGTSYGTKEDGLTLTF